MKINAHHAAGTPKAKKPASSTTLAPRKTVEHKPKKQIRWIFSWEGLEHYREQIHSLAHEVVASDAELRANMRSSAATGCIIAAIRDPSTASSPAVARAAEAQRALRDLTHKLVWEHHLEFDFVRRESAPILNPVPAEVERCEWLVQEAMRKQMRGRGS
jgi:hypothetical protein